jgi:hypothetical protein
MIPSRMVSMDALKFHILNCREKRQDQNDASIYKEKGKKMMGLFD